ncbi:MAG: hypothetical protein ABI234_04185 [Ktedonobacteraceae bacterium]
MSHTTPDDFNPLHSDEQGNKDEIIHPTSFDQPELTTGEEANTSFSVYQSDLTTAEETSSTPSAEDMLPPEARGEVNGGPLGCCLGVTVGLFLSLFVAVLSRFYADPLTTLFHQNYGLMGVLIRILMSILAVMLAILCGRFGWKLGRRFYREYEPPPVKKRKRRSQLQKPQQKS